MKIEITSTSQQHNINQNTDRLTNCDDKLNRKQRTRTFAPVKFIVSSSSLKTIDNLTLDTSDISNNLYEVHSELVKDILEIEEQDILEV